MLFESLTPPTLVTGQESKHRDTTFPVSGICPEASTHQDKPDTPQLGHGRAFDHSAASFCF